MQKDFSLVPNIKIPRSVFKRPHELKTTIGVDYLYPIWISEALPGDTVKFKGQFFGRLSTPIVPLMDNLYLDTFFFAVPIRLIDDNFRRVMGERPFGDTTTEYTIPSLNTGSSGVDSLSLSDYLGIPVGVPNLDVCPYWHRSYNLIYNEWFRQEDICEPAPIGGLSYDGTQVDEALSQYPLRKRCKRADAFTSCLPWPQKGDPVGINLTGDFAVSSFDNLDVSLYGTGLSRTVQSGYPADWRGSNLGSGGSTNAVLGFKTTASSPQDCGSASLRISKGEIEDNLSVNLEGVNAVTINSLIQAFATQSLLHRDAVGGTRLIELIRSHFGVISPDARMQRPEYLGGFSQPVVFTSVPQTDGTGDYSYTPQGNLAAFATVSAPAHFIKSFTEHCILLGLANLRADCTYDQGLPKMFQRKTRFDFYWPALANLGEDAILNRTIFAQGNNVLDEDDNPVDEGVFGYQERWWEYRYHPNQLTGRMRTEANAGATTYQFWHLAQHFSTLPTLSQQFLEQSTPISRIMAVPNEPPLLLDCYFDEVWTRPLPMYSIPGLGRYL